MYVCGFVAVEATCCKLILYKVLLTMNVCHCVVIISVNTTLSCLGNGSARSRMCDGNGSRLAEKQIGNNVGGRYSL